MWDRKRLIKGEPLRRYMPPVNLQKSYYDTLSPEERIDKLPVMFYLIEWLLDMLAQQLLTVPLDNYETVHRAALLYRLHERMSHIEIAAGEYLNLSNRLLKQYDDGLAWEAADREGTLGSRDKEKLDEYIKRRCRLEASIEYLYLQFTVTLNQMVYLMGTFVGQPPLLWFRGLSFESHAAFWQGIQRNPAAHSTKFTKHIQWQARWLNANVIRLRNKYIVHTDETANRLGHVHRSLKLADPPTDFVHAYYSLQTATRVVTSAPIRVALPIFVSFVYEVLYCLFLNIISALDGDKKFEVLTKGFGGTRLNDVTFAHFEEIKRREREDAKTKEPPPGESKGSEKP